VLELEDWQALPEPMGLDYVPQASGFGTTSWAMGLGHRLGRPPVLASLCDSCPQVLNRLAEADEVERCSNSLEALITDINPDAIGIVKPESLARSRA